MNNSKILTIGCAIAISLAPHAVKAATMETGLNACADALVSELATSNGAPLGYRVSPESSTSQSRLKRREKIHLDVHNPESREVVARADCTVDNHGQVRKLVTVPLDAADAEERASAL